MNEKVTQMVSLLFRDVRPSDEVRALHDEVLNNCQDRFADLTENGLDEEEALAAVMESLKGMEDVLKDYPRRDDPWDPAPEKAAAETVPEEAAEGSSSPARFAPDAVRAVDASLTWCEVEVLASDGEFSLETRGAVLHRLEPDGTLLIWQEKPSDDLFRGISWERSLDSFDSFSDAMGRLGQNLSRLFTRGLKISPDGQESRILLRIPRSAHPDVRLRTTSGGIAWEDAVPGGEFTLRSTSGDIRVRTDPGFMLPSARITTMSGDAEVRLSAEDLEIASVSGDVSWEGEARTVTMSSTSGDAEAVGTVRNAALNTTSGDVTLELTAAGSAEIAIRSVSGDIDVRLPQEVREVSARLKSVSGEIRQRGVEIADDAPVSIEAGTVSGDLRLFR